MTPLDAMKQALEAFELTDKWINDLPVPTEGATYQMIRNRPAITALTTAIEELEKAEPVAWVLINSDGECEQIDYCKENPLPGDDGFTPLYDLGGLK